MAQRIGIDVGGTNTDAVLVDGDSIIAEVKVPTTPDVTTGIVSALSHLKAGGEVDVHGIRAVMIGTTQFTNAVVEARGLNQAAAIRIGLPATAAVRPMIDWPASLRRVIGDHVFMVHGGYEFDGSPISPFSEEEVTAVAAVIRAKGLKSAAVTSVFSPLNDAQEKRAAEILFTEIPGIRVSRSSELGRLGLLERENATIMNASMADLADHIVGGLQAAVAGASIEAPILVSQNDGTLMSADYARQFPAATFASGPTNSIRGAAFLSHETDCVVVDVGGTTTDIGFLRKGFPREASSTVNVGGVRTNFRMPDIASLALGGGTIVRTDPELTIGPDSVGYLLTERALVFGGEVLTASDIAVAAGNAEFGDPSRVNNLDPGLVSDAVALMQQIVTDGLDRMKPDRDAVVAVLVGGGSVIVPDSINGVSRVVRPPHYPVANAVGASIAHVGGEVDRVVYLERTSRASALDRVKQEAMARCEAAGAEADTIRVVDIDEVPLTYLPSNAVRLRIKVVGDLNLAS